MSQRVNVTCYACVLFESPYIKLKFKAVSVQATGVANGGTAPLALKLGARWGEWSDSFPVHFIPGKRKPIPIKQNDRWTLQAVWSFCKTGIFYRLRASNHDPSAAQPCDYTYTLSRTQISHKYISRLIPDLHTIAGNQWPLFSSAVCSGWFRRKGQYYGMTLSIIVRKKKCIWTLTHSEWLPRWSCLNLQI